MKATFVLSTLVSALLFAAGEAHTLKQAKARDVASREKFADVFARAPGGTGTGNTCPNGDPCTTPCCSDCTLTRKRDVSAKRDLWIIADEFPGEIYSAKIIAELIKGDGVFTHHNGSTVTDWDYKVNSESNRLAFWKNKRAGSGMMERIKRGFINFSVPYLSKTIAMYFSDEDKVFMLSEASGIKNKDIIRMAKALLEEKEQQEFLIWHHTLDRSTIEAVVSTLCPRLGPQYCEN